MYQELVRRLQQRLRKTPSTDLERAPGILPRPVLTVEAIEAAEAELGFPLPPLVRSLYLQVANGGYGPGWGILPLNEENRPSVVAYDHLFRQSWKDSAALRRWPEPFIRFNEWGCNIYSGIDCSKPACPVIRFDPHRDGRNDANFLIEESSSLTEWLTAWLDGENLWERVAPTTSKRK